MYTKKDENLKKRVGVEIEKYEGIAESYIQGLLEEIGFILEKKTRGYMRLKLEGVGCIIVHGDSKRGEELKIYLPRLRVYNIRLYENKILYRYSCEKKEVENRMVEIKEFTDSIMEKIREIWNKNKEAVKK